MRMLGQRLFIVLWLLPLAGWGQKPVIFPDGVVNAASYATTSTPWLPSGKSVSLGSIVSIFGTNLAGSSQEAANIPLPTKLGGTFVTVDCIAAPLFYVSPGQINFQMPSPYGGGTCVLPGSKGIVVTTAAGASDPYFLAGAGAPGIFTQDASGCGQGSVLNIHRDGTVSVNSPADSVSPGEYISIYGTGLGLVYDSPPDGVPAQSTPPLARSTLVPGFVLDLTLHGPTSLDYWAGRAPGLVGVDQFNYVVPDTVREGCAVPLQVLGDYGISQPVTISIRKGGGTCVDPPSGGYGQITWEKTSIVEPLSSPKDTDTLTISLQASPGQRLPQKPTGTRLMDYSGPSCRVPGYRSLDAGAMTIQAAGFGPAQAALAPLEEGQVSGLSIYHAPLPTGTIQAGSFNVSAGGGADVGAFQSTLHIGEEIRIVTALAGRVISNRGPAFTIEWTGGDPNAWVTPRLVSHRGSVDWSSLGPTVRASAGSVTMGPNPTVGYAIGEGPVELVVEETPGEPQAFSAPGLSLGGQHLWKYTFRYQGLLLQ